MEGIGLAREAGDPILEAKARLNLVGHVYGPTGRIEEAVGQIHAVLAGADAPHMAVLKGIALMNLGNVRWVEGNAKEGERRLRQAARLFRNAGLLHRESAVANNLAALFAESGDLAKSAWWARRALRLAETFSQREHATSARLNLISSLLTLGKAPQAQTQIELTLAQARSQMQEIRLAHAHLRKACSALLLGDGEALREAAREAVLLFREFSHPREAASSLAHYARYCHQLRCPEQWTAFLHDLGFDPLPLLERAQDATLPLLRALHQWSSPMEPALRDGRLSPFSGLPEDSADALVFLAEDRLEGIERGEDPSGSRALVARMEALPHFEIQVASLLLRETAPGRLGRADGARCGRLLRRCAGGVHGLRLLGRILQRGGLHPRSQWEREARRRLVFFRSRNPPWAWEALLRFPEVRKAAERLDPAPPP